MASGALAHYKAKENSKMDVYIEISDTSLFATLQH